MKEGQDAIYYVTADSFPAARNSPHLEVFRKHGVEVLLLNDRVDEWMLSMLTEFDGKPLQSVAQGELDLGKLGDDSAEQEQNQRKKNSNRSWSASRGRSEGKRAQCAPLPSDRFTGVPGDRRARHQPNLERMLMAAGQTMPSSKPILEINPRHPIVQRLKQDDEARFADWSHLLSIRRTLAEGGELEDPASFVKRLNTV